MYSSTKELSRKVYFPNLDGLRSLAFFLVFFQHGFWNSLEVLEIESNFLRSIIYGLGSGATGVSIFFVLSGFLITYLLLSEKESTGKINIWFFYIRRILRIWPLYYAVIIFAFIIYPFLKSILGIDVHSASNPAYYFTFLANFDVINIHKLHPGANAMMEGNTWSVAIEEQFYLVWPLLFLFTPKRFYAGIFLVIVSVCLIFRLLNMEEDPIIYFHTLSVCADLAIGGISAYFILYSRYFRNFFQNLNKPVILLFYILGLAWMLYGGLLLSKDYNIMFSRLVNTLFFAFIILEQNFSHNSFYKFSKSRYLTFWGKYTYGLYLLHPIALLIIDISLRMLNINYKGSFILLFMIGVIGLCLSLVLSFLSYEFYEKRFLRIKDRFSFIQNSYKPNSEYSAQKQAVLK